MHHLPVVATAVAAYRLLAREVTTIVRLSWAILFIVALVQYFLARTVLAHMASALAHGDVVVAAAVGRNAFWLTLKMAAEVIGTAIIAVALHELVLFGDRKQGQYVHIAFGRREALFITLGLALLAASIPFATIAISPFGEPNAGLAPFFATLVLIVALYVSIRLWPILPIIVVERRFDFAAAWSLTRGRFWSLLALVLLGLIPIGLVALMIDSALPSFDSLMDAITGGNKVPRAADAMIAVKRAQRWLAVRVLFDLVTSIVSTALAVALISYSYLMLTGPRPAQVLEDEQE